MLIIPYPSIIPTVILSTGKTQLLPYLKGHDLLGFIDGSTHALYPQFVSTMFQPQLWYALLGLGKTNFS